MIKLLTRKAVDRYRRILTRISCWRGGRSALRRSQFITRNRSRELKEDLASLDLEGEFLCSHLSYAVPDEAFHFSERMRIPLLGKGCREGC